MKTLGSEAWGWGGGNHLTSYYIALSCAKNQPHLLYC